MIMHKSVLLFADADEAMKFRPGAHPPDVHLCTGEATIVFDTIQAARTWAARVLEASYAPIDER